MFVSRDIEPCRRAIRELQAQGRTVGLVPTMGALHAGHRSLIMAAAAACDAVAVSIFVNPTQFAPHEDFAAYPRPLEADLDVCVSAGVSLVFTPDVPTMFPAEARTRVHVAQLGDGLCGAFRPGHFDGVATVVAKLFQILPADVAFFGEKDYQQLAIIRQMARDLNLPIDIVGCPTVREPDGLALSSRNVYLTPGERVQAVSLSHALLAAVERVGHGELCARSLIDEIRGEILAAGPAGIDYVEVVDAKSLVPLEFVDRAARICLAVRIGTTRLIDNVAVAPPNEPALRWAFSS